MDNDLENQDTMLPQKEVEEVVRILGDIAVMNCDLQELKRTLMERMSVLLDADGWLWSATKVIKEKACPFTLGLIYGGLTDLQIYALHNASQIAEVKPPEDIPFTKLFCTGQHFTRTRQQIVSNDIWYDHPTVKKYRIDLGIDNFLYSIYPIEPSCCSAIGFFRNVGREPFTDIQRRICHIIFSNVKWLHEGSFPDHKGESCLKLTPRLRSILVFLLDGKKRNEIAEILHISPQTAKTHIRNIYKHFEVNSQVELMRYFQVGNGNDMELAG